MKEIVIASRLPEIPKLTADATRPVDFGQDVAEMSRGFAPTETGLLLRQPGQLIVVPAPSHGLVLPVTSSVR